MAKSEIILLRSDIRQDTDILRLEKYLDRIKEREAQKPAAHYRQVLDYPSGERLRLEVYDTIQNDFPDVYGIGSIGLPASATEQRQAQALQLKAYLLFFEQLITNFFAQLAHVRDLFATDGTIERTYFYQPLYQVPDAALLLKGFIEHVQAAPDTGQFKSDWESFQHNLQNAYLKGLSAAIEDPELFQQRRNQFLNHLLARFCEDFTDYSLSLYNEWGANLIRDKISFLKDWPRISAARGTAFNYRLKDADGRPLVWDGDNIASLARKLSYLLGLSDFRRRNLSRDAAADFERYQQTDANGLKVLKFRLRDENGNIILAGVIARLKRDDLEQDIQEVVRQGGRRSGYRIDEAAAGRYFLHIVDYHDKVLAESPKKFDSRTAAENARDELIVLFHHHEGFYLIEHILLRPKYSGKYAGEALSDKHLILQEEDRGEKSPLVDPYSFRVSFIFPDWTAKFSDPDFKVYINRLIARELPAHIIAHTYYLSQASMQQFEQAYKDWLELSCLDMPLDRKRRELHIVSLHHAHAELIKQMNSMAQSS